uniref:Uncharacterized protein n=1 Tax=Rhizophora mucronata TaxID=61149 RepID=A0A2P2J0F1_RHIMU
MIHFTIMSKTSVRFPLSKNLLRCCVCLDQAFVGQSVFKSCLTLKCLW